MHQLIVDCTGQDIFRGLNYPSPHVISRVELPVAVFHLIQR